MLSGALDELDELLVVTTMEVPALLQMKQLLQYLRDQRFSANKTKLILNRVVRRPAGTAVRPSTRSSTEWIRFKRIDGSLQFHSAIEARR